MAYLIRFGLLLTCLTLAACGQLLSAPVQTDIHRFTPGNYQLDPHHTTVLFKVDHLGVSSFVGRFNRADAQLDYNAQNPAASEIRAEVELASLDVNRPDFADTLTSCDWLCAKKYPKAYFSSSANAEVTGQELRFPGKLQFRGVTADAQLQVTLRGSTTNRLTGDEVIGFDAKLHFQRSEFGMDSYIPLIGDAVVIEVYAEFIRRK
ncbi:YceI family protein [Gilvimarinus polysaccharolyticus]|uniref:YceI family protein n=1 Tax=Gilvimarinus polysaccharolyticus TaxID=863921 RepID=UPI0006738021|nr:YceI family protein [Gilvimarinus polysaccharolyticus]